MVLIAGCTVAGSPGAAAPVLPVPAAAEVTFYLGLPGSTDGLAAAVEQASTPGGAGYRRFLTVGDAAGRYGAPDDRLDAAAGAVAALGLRFATDPTRLFARVTGSPEQWATALGTPLAVQQATEASPFRIHTLPPALPAGFPPAGTALLLPTAQTYDAAAEGKRRSPVTSGAPGAEGTGPNGAGATASWPVNGGTPVQAGCSTPLLSGGHVYTQQQIQTVYGIDRLRSAATGAPVITVLDLGGGWSSRDLELAGDCFGFTPPTIVQAQGDGVPAAITNVDGETSLDLQNVSAVAPGATVRLVQSTNGGGGLLDAFSRALGDPAGPPDVMSLSYGGCAIAEERSAPEYVAAVEAVLAMAAVAGVSTVVAAGDTGSTTCPTSAVPGTSMSYPAVSAFVTAVGGTRLALGAGNVRVTETVWNDATYGVQAAGGGGVSRTVARPAYQKGVNDSRFRAVPDVSALADISPGWPVVTSGSLHTVGGTSGSAPLTAASIALVAGTERAAGRPSVGLANGWFYSAGSGFFDVVTGANDIQGVGCCGAGPGYDTASGLGVPDWSVLPRTLPAPS
jgi:subtilase family serine protease